MPRHLSFSGSTSNFAAASPTLGLSESLILAAGFSDIELDFNMLEGGSRKGGGRLGDGKSPRDQL